MNTGASWPASSLVPLHPSCVTSGKWLNLPVRGIVTAPTSWARIRVQQQHVRTAAFPRPLPEQEPGNGHSSINNKKKIQIITVKF